MKITLEELAKAHGVLLADGATGTNLFRAGLETGYPPELWNVEHANRITTLYEEFVDGFVKQAEALNVGNGLDEGVKMGPLAHDRRLTAIEGFVADAVENGAKVLTGGKRKGNKGYFFEPTVMTNVSNDARIMNEEPFGPLAPINSFSSIDEVVEESNRLNYGLAAYAYTNSAKTAQDLGQAIESGQVSINQHGLGLVDTPFGGVKDSGYGSEGGPEGLDAYMTTKLVSQTGL